MGPVTLRRGLVVELLILAVFIALLLRVLLLQTLDFEKYQSKVIDQLTVESVIDADRGNIYDRQGRLLATNVTAYRVFIAPRTIQSVQEENYGEGGTQQAQLIAAGLSERHVRAFLKICDPEKRLEVLNEVTRSSLSVEQTEALIDKVLCPVSPETQKAKRKIGIKDARLVYNTIDRAVESIESIGVPIEKTRHEDEETVEFVLKIKKPPTLKPRSAVIGNPEAV